MDTARLDEWEAAIKAAHRSGKAAEHTGYLLRKVGQPALAKRAAKLAKAAMALNRAIAHASPFPKSDPARPVAPDGFML